MRKLALVSLALAVSFSSIKDGQAELARGSKMYIQPFNRFESYLAAAFSKKHVPVVLVQTADQADLKLSILNYGQRIAGLRVENKEKEIVWTYMFKKPVKGQLKEAEKCAVQLRQEFPLSPEELAVRERQRQEQEAEQRQKEAQRATLQASAQPQTTQLCYGRYPVPPGRYLAFPFQVTGTATLQGSFEVAGGAGNDIQVVIGPRSEVLNWLNGHSGAITYASEKLTSGTVNVSIPAPGDYMLAFSNTFSIVSEKMIAANMQLVSSGAQ